ncbi:helix-turn-helix transcriptional regulator [Streptomyces sp900105245]|uniref:Helix-turn-helix transcriptional regulator n=1 Tax=Streptomyces sp. 900105245 TaxID=3154379 RepID=A0ABV1UKX1_9ACTN
MGVPVVERWRLAGRAGELEVFGRVWGERGCRVVVVAGAAGVGKTRLAEECLAQAAEHGWKGARATATPVAAAVPLGAIAHLIPPGVDLADPARVFAQVARALTGVNRQRKRALLVDDLHLLDASSAVLLRQLLDAGALRLITTVRTGEPPTDAVRALTGGDGAHRIDLGPFSEGQLEQVLRAALGRPAGRRTLHMLHTASGGNALYLRELVQGALTNKTLTCDGEIWELAEEALSATPKLTELIAARLAAADPAGREVLELLALCEPLPLADLAATAPARLESAGLIRIHQDYQRTTATLAHPLYGEALRAGLPALRRHRLLLDQAERTRARGARRREDALHLATWQLAATGTADPALLVRAATLARHAQDFRQVAELLGALPKGERTFTSCLLHGDTLVQLGQNPQLADALLAEAQTRATGDTEKITAVLARVAHLWQTADDPRKALNPIISSRREIRDHTGSRLLRLLEGAVRATSGDPAVGLALLEDLETDPRQAPHIGVWTLTSMAKVWCLGFAGRNSEAIAWGEQAAAGHMQIHNQEVGYPPSAHLALLALAYAEAGRLSLGRETAEQSFTYLAAKDAPVGWIYTAFARGRVEWLAGDIAAARRWYAEVLDRAAQHYRRLFLPAYAGIAASAAILGDLKTAQEMLAKKPEITSASLYPEEESLGQSWLLAARGHLDKARAVLREEAQTAREAGHVASEMLLLTDIARLGGAQHVSDRLSELNALCDGPFAPARAHLATALTADDPNQLCSVASELEAVGADLLAAEAATQAATGYHRRGESRRATACANHAARLTACCEGARTPLLAAPRATAALTRREREIALLAAAGQSSKTIADALHLSVRTVDNHLQHAYTKLGVTTRTELTTALTTNP